MTKLQPKSVVSTAPAIIIKPKLTVCITSLNDNEEANNTVRSIRETAGDIEVVVVDDSSTTHLVLDDKSVKFYRTPKRAGVGPARDIAVSMATGTHVLITDSHMRFDPPWLKNLTPR